MSLRDYDVPRDSFALAEQRTCGGNSLCFPCALCIHSEKRQHEEPCRTCDHNVNAVKDTANAPVVGRERTHEQEVRQ